MIIPPAKINTIFIILLVLVGHKEHLKAPELENLAEQSAQRIP